MSYYLCECCKDTDEPDDELIADCDKCGRQICDDCVVSDKPINEITYGFHVLPHRYCPFCASRK